MATVVEREEEKKLAKAAEVVGEVLENWMDEWREAFEWHSDKLEEEIREAVMDELGVDEEEAEKLLERIGYSLSYDVDVVVKPMVEEVGEEEIWSVCYHHVRSLIRDYWQRGMKTPFVKMEDEWEFYALLPFHLQGVAEEAIRNALRDFGVPRRETERLEVYLRLWTDSKTEGTYAVVLDGKKVIDGFSLRGTYTGEEVASVVAEVVERLLKRLR